MLEISTIEINVIATDAHLGILRKCCILPVIVQSAIAKIIEAKNSISISFKLHKIIMEIIIDIIENKLVDFKLVAI